MGPHRSDTSPGTRKTRKMALATAILISPPLSERPPVCHSQIMLSLFKATITLQVCMCCHWDSEMTKFEKYQLRGPQEEWGVASTILLCPLVASCSFFFFFGHWILALSCKQPLLNIGRFQKPAQLQLSFPFSMKLHSVINYILRLLLHLLRIHLNFKPILSIGRCPPPTAEFGILFFTWFFVPLHINSEPPYLHFIIS